jgi:N-acetyl-gamma-glutamyl-phosphate reductase
MRVSVAGATGYAGGELLRLLIRHPEVELVHLAAGERAGASVGEVWPNLEGLLEATFTELDGTALGEASEIVITALPDGLALDVIPDILATGARVVDVGPDFRLGDPDRYRRHYGRRHTAPELLDEAVYGLPEWNDDTRSARLIANPGCYATGITLALAPLAAQGVSFSAHVTALTGASGSGATPSSATHFPTRDGNVRPYKVLAHQHGPEITQTIGSHLDLHFVPASGPWTRGIWGTAQIDWPSSLTAATVEERFAEAYGEAPFVRCSSGALPSLQPTVGTPFCDVGWQQQGDTLVVGFALDNLLKGAASQAVHNLNRALGLPETAGLLPRAESAKPTAA